jgi:inosose dehydratase
MPNRRDFLTTAGAGALWAAHWPAASAAAAPAIRFACHTMPWGDDYEAGIADIGRAGFGGIQLRANVQARYGDRPAGLKALLATHGVQFVCFSSGNVLLGADREAETLALHERHARFAQAAGGQFLQVTDERPADRLPTADDRKRMGDLLTRLGRKTQSLGVKLAYHNHIGNLGERPEEIAEVLAATDPASVTFLLDVAHYAQAGGDVAHAIRTHAARLGLLHVKDVRTRPQPAAGAGRGPTYQFVELGRGRVDLRGAFAALAEIGYQGWGIVELDAVPDAGGSASASMLTSKQYIEQVLKLPLQP